MTDQYGQPFRNSILVSSFEIMNLSAVWSERAKIKRTENFGENIDCVVWRQDKIGLKNFKQWVLFRPNLSS